MDLSFKFYFIFFSFLNIKNIDFMIYKEENILIDEQEML
jgi:hypothetical protein